MRKILLLASGLLLMSLAGLQGQSRDGAQPEAAQSQAGPQGRAQADGRAQGKDREAILATVKVLFDGMRTADTVLVNTAFHSQARVLITSATGKLRLVPPKPFLVAVANSTRRWDERIWDPEVRVDADLATVWAPYVFYFGGELHHCGIDALQLSRTDEGWKIVTLADTHRTEGCEDGSGKGPPESPGEDQGSGHQESGGKP